MKKPIHATSGPALEDILQRCRTASHPPLPWLADHGIREVAQRRARENGTLESMLADPLLSDPIPAETYTSFRDFRRTGNRVRHEAVMGRRMRMLEHAAATVWLGGGARDRLQDMLWAFCEASRWTLPAHEYCAIDLLDAHTARTLAEITTALAGDLEDDVTNRVHNELRRRIFDTFLDPASRKDVWRGNTNNWNAVCHSGVTIAALLCETRVLHREEILRQSLAAHPLFLAGFTSDGGCSEGPSYWTYGFGWFVAFAEAVRHFTGGGLDLLLNPHVEKILHYLTAVSAAPGQPFEFADASPVFMPPSIALAVQASVRSPGLFSLCPPVSEWHFSMLSDRIRAEACLGGRGDLVDVIGRPEPPPFIPADSLLPGLNVARLVRGGTVLGAKGGDNAEHHNHNDLGNFILFRGNTWHIAELGAPVYTRRTFSAQRYESAYCSAAGHSVPRLNGAIQANGLQYAAPLSADFDAARLDIDLAKAYPADAGVEKFTRRLALSDDGKKLTLEDAFVFSNDAPQVVEQFITFQPAALEDGGRTVALDNVLRVRCGSHDGCFTIEEIPDCAAEDRQKRQGLRLVFMPCAALEKNETFRFAFEFA